MPDPSARTERNAPIWVKLFVAFHLVAITVWALPDPPKETLEGKRKAFGTENILVWNRENAKAFQPIPLYLLTTGFWQYWDMFSPNPAQIDIWCDAQVVYKDGSTKHYQYPRIALLPLEMKFLKERYRKFYERVNQDQYSYLWPPFAQRIAHLMDDPNNPPVEVLLTRHWLQVVPPGVKQPTEYNHYTYYDYAVDQKKLERDRVIL